MTRQLQINVEFQRGHQTIAVNWQQPLDHPSVTVLFGPSGCGKTTILRGLAGLEVPVAGHIRWHEELWYDASRRINLSPQQRRVGFLFQDYALFPHLTVAQNIVYGMDRTPRSGRSANDWLQRFQLAGLADRLAGQLSGGEQQRVALARTLAAEPRLLLLDEPLSALDDVLRRDLRIELKRLLTENGIPVVLVTHDRLEAMSLADQIVVLEEGHMLQRGDVAEVFSRPASPAVARIVGTETVVQGKCLGWENGLSRIDVCGEIVHVISAEPITGLVHLCIQAEHVTLQKTAPLGQSVRNQLPAKITAIIPEGPLLRVQLDCGFPLAALISHSAGAELDLCAGKAVTACFKATAIHLIPD